MLNIDEPTGKIMKPNNKHNIDNLDDESQGLYSDCVHCYKDEFNNICIDCDLPGRGKDNIHIYWNGYRDLTIIADEYKDDYYSRERVYISFHFENNMDYDNSTATYNNGVLTVSAKRLNDKNNENI